MKSIIGLPGGALRSEKVMIKALLCKLNIRHEWHVEHTEDGSLYKRCLRCGKDDDRGGGGTGTFGAWAGPAGG
ncbi:UNVERIFIED_ORG: hypothetical protein J2X79_003555 [Arthrobacter globiformis]|nr:hypothetical protein [Arthrobacter globiformis]